MEEDINKLIKLLDEKIMAIKKEVSIDLMDIFKEAKQIDMKVVEACNKVKEVLDWFINKRCPNCGKDDLKVHGAKYQAYYDYYCDSCKEEYPFGKLALNYLFKLCKIFGIRHD